MILNSALKLFYFSSDKSIKIIHDELQFVIRSRTLLLNRDAFRFNGQMPFDHVEGVVDWFDQFDLGKLDVNICLDVRTHEFQNFVEK